MGPTAGALKRAAFIDGAINVDLTAVRALEARHLFADIF